MIKKTLFGWFDQTRQEWRLSQYPPDAPVRPSVKFPDKNTLLKFAERKRATVLWWPPLTLAQQRDLTAARW